MSNIFIRASLGFSNSTAALDERNSVGPRLTSQGGVDEDQVFPPSEADRPTYATIIDDTHYADGHASERCVV